MSQPPLFKAKLILTATPFILAVLALVGWVWGIDSLKRGMTSSVAMNPATAVCMILLAFEAIRLNVNNGQAVLYKAGQLAILIVIAVSAMKLSDLLLGSSFAIDQQLFSSKLDAESDQPSRMAPNTAICFFILGWAMQLIRVQADSLLLKAQLLATGSMLLALLALVGHLFGAQEFSGVAHYIPMAINTAFAFVLISANVLLAFPGKGFMRVFFGDSSSGLRAITTLILPASIVIPLAFVWLSYAGAAKGFYDMEFSLAFTVITSIVALLFLSYIAARRLFLSDAESRQLHTAMLQSDEAHRSILAATLDGFWLVGPEGKLLEVNSRYAEQSGYSREELLGMSIPDLEAAESASDTAAHIQRIIEKGGDQFESKHLRKDGSVWDVEVSTTFLASGGGRFFVFLRDITGRKNIEKELKLTKERYDYAMAIGKVGTWDWNPVTGDLVWSDEMFRLLGFVPGGVTPSFELFLEMVHPDDREFLTSAVQASLDDRKPYTLDCRIVTGGENKLVCHVDGKVEFDAQGKPTRMLGTIQDISERKRAEQILIQHKKVLDTAIDGFWMVDAGGNLLEANAAYEMISGYSADELKKMHISQLEAKEESVEEVSAHIAKIIADGFDRFETRHRHKDGHEIDIEISTQYLPETQQFAVFARDITERKQAEEALRIAAISFEKQEGMVITDANGVIQQVNHAFTEISGYSAEEAIGQTPKLLKSGRHDAVFYAAMWESILRTGAWNGEIWNRRKNGEVYPERLSITAVKDAGGKTTHYVAAKHDISGRKRAEAEIHSLAFYDSLTKLPNRRLFLDRFDMALTASARNNNFGAVLFIDLDRFKLLNDTFGHDYGDLLLIEVAVRIKACVREMDTVARMGGDEFVVLIEEIGNDQDEASHKAGLITEKIRGSLARPYDHNGHEHHSSPSIGVTLYRGNDVPVDTLLQHADMAMYQAKDSGRNAVRFYDPGMQNNVAARAALVNDLRSAIAQRQLHLYYQVQVDNNNRPVGAEALLRWIHPQRGMVMPEQFLPVSEKSTLILDISDWVLESACQQLVLWGKNEKTRDLVLTVNISNKQFSMPNFVGKVADMLQRYQIIPARLKLELTESMALDDITRAVEKMHALKALGVSLSMDDFGTRYSSLSNLKQLPLDQIKLGRSFVHDVVTDGNVALLVQSIIDLSSKQRITVIAEGVETTAQLTSLKDRDCVAYQGFLFSKALSMKSLRVC